MQLMQISVADIADAIEAGLRRRLESLDLEHAVYGLDSLDELALHPVIEQALKDANFGVHREQRYPAHRVPGSDRPHSRLRLREGERCDFVLTAEGRDLIHPDAAGTLFDPDNAVSLDEAFWLEAKIVAQFNCEGPNANYASQLLSTVRHDVTKLSKDEGILRAGLLLVMFVRDRSVAEHDLNIWQDRCLGRGLPIGAPAMRFIPMNDRHGNALCAIAVYPVSHL